MNVVREKTNVRGVAPAWGVLIALLLIVFAGAASQWRGAGVGQSLILVWICTVWSSVRLALLISAGADTWWLFTFYLFNYVFLGLAPLAQMTSGQWPSTTPYLLSDSLLPASWMIVVWILAFEAGRLICGPMPSFSVERRSGVRSRMLIFLTTLSLAVGLYYAASVGGALFQSRQALDVAKFSHWSLSKAQLIAGVATMMPLALAHASKTALSARPSRTLKSCLVINVGLVVVLLNPISSPRYVFGTAMLSLAHLFGLFSTARRRRVMLLVLIAGFVVLFPISDVFRRDHPSLKEVKLTSQFLGNGDFDAFAQLRNCFSLGQSSPQPPLRQFAGVVGFAVPRPLWPGKPIDTGVLIAQEFGYEFVNLSAPLVGEAYVNGGWAMVVVVGVLVGVTTTLIDARSSSDSARAMVLSGVLPFYMIIVYRGSLLQATGYLAAILMGTFLVTNVPKRASLFSSNPRVSTLPAGEGSRRSPRAGQGL